MLRQELRRSLLEARLKLDARRVKAESSKVTVNFFTQIPIKDHAKILVYLPIKNEVDTGELIEKLARLGKDLFVPAFINKNWVICKFDPQVRLEKVFGEVFQPTDGPTIDAVELDAAIVPGVAFSKNGARLGFGLGVYDRLLAKTSAAKIGICYDFQIVDDFPTRSHDVRMDYIVSGGGILKVT